MASTKKSQDRYEVPLSIVLFLLITYFITANLLFVKIALGLGIVMMLSRSAANLITKIWQRIMVAVGFVNSHIILSLIFFVILTPLSALYRLFKKDSLNTAAGKSTYFVERNHQFQKGDLENPW